MLGGMVVLGCKGSGGSSPVEEKQAALSTCDRTFSVSFPAGVSRDAVVFASNASLTIRDGVHLLEPTSGFAASSNNGSATLNIGNDTRIGSVTSVGSVVLGDRASVTGDVRTSGTITKGNSVVITGSAVQHATLTPPTTMSWSVCFPSTTHGDVDLEPDTAQTLAPGSYGSLAVKSRAKLSLTSGTYVFRSIDIEPQAVLQLNKSNGPIALYASDSVIYEGSLVDQGGNPDDFFIGYAGTQAVFLGGSFRGAFAAPNADLVLTTVPGGFTGTFFAHDIEAQAQLTVTHRPFPSWDTLTTGPNSNTQAGSPPSLMLANRVLHHPPPLNTPADVPAFIDWAGFSTVVEREDGRAVIQAASGNDAIATALSTAFRSVETTNHSRALLTLAVLGEMRNGAGETFLTSYIHEPLPSPEDFVGGEGEDARITAKATLQAKAVTGLAYRATTTSLAQVLWAAGQHPSRVVRAEAIAAFLAWNPQSAGGVAGARTILGSIVQEGEQIFIDRVRRDQGETATSFNAKLAAYLQLHPEALPPDPVKNSQTPPPPPSSTVPRIAPIF
jgi:hypothetical protein